MQDSFFPPSRRFDVKVIYPLFRDDGEPYFSNESPEDNISMTDDELKYYKWQEKEGFLKIINIEPQMPDPR